MNNARLNSRRVDQYGGDKPRLPPSRATMPLPKKWIALLSVLALIGFANLLYLLTVSGVWPTTNPKIEDWPASKTMREAPGFYSLVGGQSWDQRLYWLDNDTVLFAGYDEHALTSGKATTTLRTWNWRTNAIGNIDVLEETRGGQLCYAEGYARYLSPGSADDEVIIKEGPIGRATERRLSRNDPFFFIDRRSRTVEQLNPFTCRWYLPTDFGPEGKCLYPLRDGDGLVDFSGRNCRPEIQKRWREANELPDSASIWAERRRIEADLARVSAVWYRSPQEPPIEMSVNAGELPFHTGGLRFSAWSHEYVIAAGRPRLGRLNSGNWPEGEPRRIYSLSPGGKVIARDMPYAEVNRGEVVTATSSKAGLIIVNARSFPGSREGPGAYLVQASRLVRVVPGHIDAVEVSPDGCRLAASVQVGERRYAAKVRAVDLCR
jgi:hypothetical protein